MHAKTGVWMMRVAVLSLSVETLDAARLNLTNVATTAIAAVCVIACKPSALTRVWMRVSALTNGSVMKIVDVSKTL